MKKNIFHNVVTFGGPLVPRNRNITHRTNILETYFKNGRYFEIKNITAATINFIVVPVYQQVKAITTNILNLT